RFRLGCRKLGHPSLKRKRRKIAEELTPSHTYQAKSATSKSASKGTLPNTFPSHHHHPFLTSKCAREVNPRPLRGRVVLPRLRFALGRGGEGLGEAVGLFGFFMLLVGRMGGDGGGVGGTRFAIVCRGF